jgi:hypothetical protein
MENGNLALFFEQLDKRLSRIENALDKIGHSHELLEERMNARVIVLELEAARQAGGKKALAGLLAAAATFGGIIASGLGYLIPRY